jgi:hypothetical protein
LTEFPDAGYNERCGTPEREQGIGMKRTLGLSLCVVGLYGLVSGDFPAGILFAAAGVIAANFFRQTRSDPL